MLLVVVSKEPGTSVSSFENPYAIESYVEHSEDEDLEHERRDISNSSSPTSRGPSTPSLKKPRAKEKVSSRPVVAESRDSDFDERKMPLRVRQDSRMAVYGKPSASAIEEASGSKKDMGLIIHAQVVSSSYFSKKHCTKDGKLKPRRPRTQARAKDFFKSIAQVD